MNEYKELAGKVALVTGGGTGLGLGISKKLAEQGVRVVITGRREEILKNACQEIGPEAKYFVCDLTEKHKLPEVVNDMESKIGPIEVLVNNAGIHVKKDVLELSDEDFDKVTQTNMSAVFSLTREVSKKMVKRGSGSILMISSMAAHYGIPKVMAYTAAKSAVEGMVRALAVELSPLGIRVNCIAPGFIYSEMSSKALNADLERKQKVLSRTPMNKLGEAEDVANAALFLVSPAAKFITGVSLPVDGGNVIGF